MQTRTIRGAAGDEVTVREWGAGDRLVLALHSMGPVSTGALYGCAAAPLVDAGHRVVAPDLPGYGLTPALQAGEYDVERLADRVWTWVDALAADQVILVGHSWGGAIALRAHERAPERVDALVLVDSGHLDYADVNGADAGLSLDEWVQRARDRRLVVPDRAALAEAVEVAADDPLMDDLLLGMAETGEGLEPRVTAEAQGAALFHLGRSRQTAAWPALGAAGTPTLLLLATEPVSAREQNRTAARAFGEVVAQADVRMVEGATHSLVTDLRADFGRTVADWLVSLR